METPLTDYQLLIKALYDKTGAIPDGKAQGAAAKWLLEHYSLTETIACLDWLLKAEWREHRISLLTVKKEIGTWKAKLKGAVMIDVKGIKGISIESEEIFSRAEAISLCEELCAESEELYAVQIAMLRKQYSIPVQGSVSKIVE
jgi:hypothetical protein